MHTVYWFIWVLTLCKQQTAKGDTWFKLAEFAKKVYWVKITDCIFKVGGHQRGTHTHIFLDVKLLNFPQPVSSPANWNCMLKEEFSVFDVPSESDWRFLVTEAHLIGQCSSVWVVLYPTVSAHLPTSINGPDTSKMIRLSNVFLAYREMHQSLIFSHSYTHTYNTEYHISIYTHQPCRQGSCFAPLNFFLSKSMFSWLNIYFLFCFSAPSGKAHSTYYSLSG